MDLEAHREKEKDFSNLSKQFEDLQSRHDDLQYEMARLTAEFDPALHELNMYKKKYEDKEKEMMQLFHKDV